MLLVPILRSSIAAYISSLLACFQPGVADGDAMDAKHVSHSALVVHALVTDDGLRWSKWCNPAMDEGFSTDCSSELHLLQPTSIDGRGCRCQPLRGWCACCQPCP